MDKSPSAPASLTVFGLGPRPTKVASEGLSIAYNSRLPIETHSSPTVDFFKQP